MSETDKKAINKLPMPQLFALRDWLAKRQDDLNGRTFRQVAEMAAVDLGFQVTEANIRGTADAAEITWESPKPKRTAEGKLQDAVAVLQEQQRQILASQAILADAIVEIDRLLLGQGQYPVKNIGAIQAIAGHERADQLPLN